MLRGLAVIMHLKYDKKVNTVINVFIFFCKNSLNFKWKVIILKKSRPVGTLFSSEGHSSQLRQNEQKEGQLNTIYFWYLE